MHNMTRQPLFIKNPDCPEGGYLVSPAGVLLMMGTCAHETEDDITPAGKARAQQALRCILSAARAGGFAQGDVLETMMARGEMSARVKELAHAAIEAAGADTVITIVRSIMKGAQYD